MGAGLDGHANAHKAAAGIVDMDKIDAEIEALKRTLPKSRGAVRKFTEEEDRKLLALWDGYSKKAVASALGFSEGVCRKRIQELRGQL